MGAPIVFDIIARDKASKTFSKIGSAAKILGVVGLGAVVKNAVSTEAAFSKSMNVLQAATNASTADMAKMQKQALKLGADTAFSSNEAADAMLELGKAGFSTKQIMSAVPQVMNLAATEGMALADAAGAVTSALAQFGMKAHDSAAVVNALAGASLASKASVAGLSQSLSMVGSSAASIGLSVQDTSAALAALAQGGLEGSIAGTSLSAVFNRLVPQTAKASSAMKRLGLDFTNADGSFKSITEIAGILQGKFKGMDQESRKLNLGKIFGGDASTLAALNALISAGAGGLKKYLKATHDQTSASRMSNAAMKGTGGALERMQGSLETASLAIGQMLAPAVVFLANHVGAAANAFVAFTPKLQAAAGFVKDNQTAFMALATAIGVVVAITKIHAAVMAVQAAGGLVAMLKATNLVTTATKAYAAVQWVLNAALTANPIGLIIVGLVALGVAIVVAYKKSETFRKIVDGAFKGVLAVAKFVWQWIKKNWPYLLGVLTGPVGMAVVLIIKHWGKIKAATSAVWNAIKGTVSGAWSAIRSIAVSRLSEIVGLVRGIPGKIGALAGKFGDVGRRLIGAFVDGMKNAAGVVSGIAGNVWDAVKSLLNSAMGKLRDALNFEISLPGPNIHVNIGDSLPSFRKGVTNFRGGLAYVHQGEMLANLPAGTDVIPANRVGGGRGGDIHITINGFVGNESQLGRELERVLSKFTASQNRPLQVKTI